MLPPDLDEGLDRPQTEGLDLSVGPQLRKDQVYVVKATFPLRIVNEGDVTDVDFYIALALDVELLGKEIGLFSGLRLQVVFLHEPHVLLSEHRRLIVNHIPCGDSFEVGGRLAPGVQEITELIDVSSDHILNDLVKFYLEEVEGVVGDLL